MKVGKKELWMIRGGYMDPPFRVQLCGSAGGSLGDIDLGSMVIWGVTEGWVATADKSDWMQAETYR